MPTKIKLNVGERKIVEDILNTYKGDIMGLSNLVLDAPAIKVEDKEWEKVERKITPVVLPDGSKGTQWNWNIKKDFEKEVEMNDTTKNFILFIGSH